MTSFPEIDQFYSTYEEYFREEYGLPRQFDEPDDDLSPSNLYALKPPKLSSQDVHAIDESLGGSALPSSYSHFVQQFSFQSLDLPGVMPPWLSFFPTTDKTALLRLNGDLGRFRLFAFCFDHYDDGKYCLDLRTSSISSLEPSVVFWRHGFATPSEAIVGPLASSFSAFLSFVTRLMDIGVFIVGDDAGASAKIADLRSLDSVLAESWVSWWSARIVKDQ